jgi:hypothetical protein
LLKQVAGYVMQDDLLNGQLTVQETLHYTAKLRCPPSFTDEQRQERVNQVSQGLLCSDRMVTYWALPAGYQLIARTDCSREWQGRCRHASCRKQACGKVADTNSALSATM